MAARRTRHGASFEARVALAAVKEDRTVPALVKEFGVHGSQVQKWKRQLLERAAELFADGRTRNQEEDPVARAELYAEIGRLQMELSWLKKSQRSSIEERRQLINPRDRDLSVRRQCTLLGLNRSSYYYEPAQETAANLELLRLIDRLYTDWPFLGSRRLREWLHAAGHAVNRKRIQRLMRLMGLEAVYPKPRLSRPEPGHRIYPYLLRGVVIDHPDQVWSTDITYLPLNQGFLYLVAILDWYSRHVLSWRLSNTLDGHFCLEALEEALQGRRRPEIFNSDQGSQFTADAFTERLKKVGVAISMDGRGRALDNVFTERLWRTVKYEYVYLHPTDSVRELEAGLASYLRFYDEQRLHQSLNYQTPARVYRGRNTRPVAAIGVKHRAA